MCVCVWGGGGGENMVWIRGMFLLKIFALNALL